MKNAILGICFALCTIVSSAQSNSIEIARIEFRKGNYKDAVGMFNGAIATVTDAQIKHDLVNEKEKSSKCWQNIESANKYFSQSNFVLAKQYYGNVLSDNPSDSYAKNQKERCVINIEKVRLLAIEKKRIDALWVELISANNISGLKSFIKDYPTHDNTLITKQLVDYYNNPSLVNNESISKKSELYISLGNIYIKYNKSVASQFYENAAMCGSLAGFYNLAISLPETEKSQIQRLLVMASVNGLENAKKLLKSKYLNLKYNEETSKTLYKYLVDANNGDIAARVAIQANRNLIGLAKLNMIDDEANYFSDKDDWQYDLGMMYLKGNQVKANMDKAISYLFDAASKGNHTAQYELAKIYKDKDNRCYYAFALCATVNGNQDAKSLPNLDSGDLKYVKAYINYLTGQPFRYFDMYLYLNFSAKKHKCEDIDDLLIGKSCSIYNTKSYKEAVNLLRSKSSWNRKTIATIQLALANSTDRRDKKMLKRLIDIKVDDVEEKPTILQTFVKSGFCSNPHPASPMKVVDIMVDAESIFITSSDNTNANNSASTNNHSNINYKIASRNNMSIGEAQSWSRGLGAGWRLATASEINKITGIYGTYWAEGGTRGILVDANGGSNTSMSPNDRAGAIAIK